ncbi:MAG: hypothetical protein ACM3NR_01385, partial [Methanosarcina sp.]
MEKISFVIKPGSGFRMQAIAALCLLFLCFSAAGQNKNDGEWRQLFNGKDMDGWKQVGPGSHYVEDGLLKSRG